MSISRASFRMICVFAALMGVTIAGGCGEVPVELVGPGGALGVPGAQPPTFDVRDSGFVHVAIGREVTLRATAGSQVHPLRPSARELVPAVWTSRDTTVATVARDVLVGRTEGMTWLVWSQGGTVDSTQLVVSAAPVGYLSPRLLTAEVNSAAVPFQSPAGDSLVFCLPPPAGSGGEISAVAGARATKPVRMAVRCRTRAGLTAALVLVADLTPAAPPVPPTAPEPLPPPPGPEPLPPPPGLPGESRAVVLQLHRFAGAENALTTSNAVPLPPGWVRSTNVDSVSLWVGDVEVPVYVAPLYGRHRDGSLRSLLLQAEVTPGMSVDGATLRFGRLRSRQRAPLASIPAPNTAGVLLPGDVPYLVSTEVVGRTIARDSVSFGDPAFSAYEFKFGQFQKIHWDARGASWGDNFYDRALAYYAFWVRTGNATYWERGTRLAINYRNGYLEANGYGAAEWWTYLEGVAVNYWLTGDPRSREAVYMTAENLWRSRGGPRLAETDHDWMDNRIQAKVLGSKLLSLQLEAPPFGIVTDWAAGARLDLDRILQTQAPDGAYRFRGTCYESSNFMSGMLASVFIDYFEHFEQDARVPVAIERNLEFLRQTQWLPAEKLFKYYSGPCATGDASPGLDLNGQFLEPIGWLAHRKADRSWYEFGDLVLAGLVERTWMWGPKQFNQAYVLSWRYHWFRARAGLP